LQALPLHAQESRIAVIIDDIENQLAAGRRMIMSAPARRSGTRNAVLRFYHMAEWLIIAAVVTAVILVKPEPSDNLTLFIAAGAYVVSFIVFARLRWPIRNEATRLVTGFVLSQFGIAAVVWYTAPALNGLLVAFVLSTTTAWLLLPGRRAIWVVALACTLSAGVALSRNPGMFDWVYAGALCACFLLTARIAEIAARASAQSEAEAVASSGRDELTQIPGRHAFLRYAERIHAQAVAGKIPYALELVDINNLRSINDTYGYAAGDRAIVVVVQALQRLRTPDEYLARYDGDKFVLLVPRLDGDRAEDLARRIRSVIFSTTVDVDTEVVRIKANVGIARYPIAGITLNALISAAERDMILDQHGRERPGKKPVFRRRSGKISA
jgi:diguanylate cyclase (GGDEF)-like protein